MGLSHPLIFLFYYCSIQITPDEVSYHDADIEYQHLYGMFRQEFYRYAHIVESICYTVRKATGNEEWHTEQQWQVLLLSSKGDRCCHDKSASYSQDTTFQRTCCQSSRQNSLCCFLQRHWRATCNKCYKQTTQQIAKENKEQLSYLTLYNKSCSAGI